MKTILSTVGKEAAAPDELEPGRAQWVDRRVLEAEHRADVLGPGGAAKLTGRRPDPRSSSSGAASDGLIWKGLCQAEVLVVVLVGSYEPREKVARGSLRR